MYATFLTSSHMWLFYFAIYRAIENKAISYIIVMLANMQLITNLYLQKENTAQNLFKEFPS